MPTPKLTTAQRADKKIRNWKRKGLTGIGVRENGRVFGTYVQFADDPGVETIPFGDPRVRQYLERQEALSNDTPTK